MHDAADLHILLERLGAADHTVDGETLFCRVRGLQAEPVYGTPHEAMVHPDEVANWQAHNWQVAE